MLVYLLDYQIMIMLTIYGYNTTSYLNDNGRAGFVMASSLDAGHSEKTIEKISRNRSCRCYGFYCNKFFYGVSFRVPYGF